MRKQSSSILIFLTLMFSILSITLVTADLFSSIEGEATKRFNSLGDTDVLLMYISIFILIFIMTSMILSKIPAFEKNKAISVIISFVTGILALYYMNSKQIIQGILIPYGILGILMTYFLPFILLFFFMHATKVSMFRRRMTWLIYIGIMTYLFIKDYPNLTETKLYIYTISFAIILISFLFDKWIHKIFDRTNHQ